MRTFKLSLDVETESPWQHRDVPSKSRVLGVFQGISPDVVSVHYEAQDSGDAGRFECEAFDVIAEGMTRGLPLGRFDPRRDPGTDGQRNALEHVGSCQLRDGRVVHVYRRT